MKTKGITIGFIIFLVILVVGTIWLEVRNRNYEEDTQNKMQEEKVENQKIRIKIKETIVMARLEDNSSAHALTEKLKEGPITLEMQDYSNYEKVAELGFELPTNDEDIVTEAGDLILYQGSSFAIYYDTNSWNLTKLGKIENLTQEELKELLGEGSVTITLEIENE